MDEDSLWSHLEKEDFKTYEVSGADFCKYYQRPPMTDCKTDHIIAADPDELNEFSVFLSYKSQTETFQSKSTQTDYRESESQTDPWDPPFKVHKVFKEPEVLYLRNFCYGNGLPASLLEVNYISRARELEEFKSELVSPESDSEFAKKKKIIWNEVKNDWNYRVAVLNEKQQEKLALLQMHVADELKRHSNKKERILKNLWENKKAEMRKTNLELQQKLHKDLKSLESNFPSQEHVCLHKRTSFKQKNNGDVPGGIDYILSNYYLSEPTGISTVKQWLKSETNDLICDILPRTNKKVQREKLFEKGPRNVFEKKKTKLPPKVYHEDYVTEETQQPTLKAETVLEVPIIEEKNVDLVTVWQQVLRGLACQKQMLELIERHKDGLSTILEPIHPGISDT